MGLREKVFIDNIYALPLIEEWRLQGEKIVFTNGCFDLLHIGHVLYLEEAKALGSKLVVGMNSDASVRRLKGKNRPIKDTYDRAHVLAALSSVDMVIVFEEDNPATLIAQIIPDVLVKGGDWQPFQIVGSDTVLTAGGIVRSLSFVEGYSTTQIEQKIRNFTVE
jgi:D-beta-D-heptose 7-phosphate kinase/D-beta-D-heptose 1-phosphate adenosyltransferase